MALREINLVPDDFLFQRRLSYHLALWIFLLILTLSPILGLHLYQTRVAHADKPSAGSLKELDERFGLKITEIKRLQNELTRLYQQEAELETESGTPVYSRVLATLSRLLGPHTWISRLALEKDHKGKRSNMNLNGFSKSGAELGDLIEDLSGRALFQDVSLIYARQAGPDEHDPRVDEAEAPELIEFCIECKVRG